MIAIGVDVGGMSIKGASVSLDGKVLETFSMPVLKGEEGTITVKKLADLINSFIKEKGYKKEEIMGVGMGIPGLIDSPKGEVFYSANLKWEKLPIKQLMEEELGLPVKITNDANAAALGEGVFGAGKEYNSSVMVTLGTGVGGGIIIDHKLFEGNEGKGAEIGHMSLILNGEPCGCGRKGCFETYASATALMREARKAMEKHPESLMWKLAENDLSKVGGLTVFDAEKQGDETAKEVLNNYVMYLGEGLLNICNIFRPNVIILSGGIAKQGKNLTDRVYKYMEDNHFGYYRSPKVDLVCATLGYHSGIIGAAALIIAQ